MTEIKVNLATLFVLACMGGTLALTDVSTVLAPRADETQELAALEDRLALVPSDARAAEELADAYLRIHRPELVVATLGRLPHVASDPAVAHRLARAFEQTGRVEDALATADLALARCARALGAAGASTVTPVPTHGCSERTYAALDVQRTALLQMRAWGVTDPARDARAERAYGLSVRAARLLRASR